MNPMLEILHGQLRNIDKSITYEVLKDTNREVLVTITWGKRIKSLLLVPTANIALGPNWYCELEGLLIGHKSADGVMVFYGYAQTVGHVADCGGNTNKDDYRRLGYCNSADVVQATECTYKEIERRATEENLKKFLQS